MHSLMCVFNSRIQEMERERNSIVSAEHFEQSLHHASWSQTYITDTQIQWVYLDLEFRLV